ncbi:sulfite exporter TauE/SafE family protein [Rhodoferax sp.]|uniref:sulfite exporter TauE/SafE family protein n=1 Tax=Rhodoferax sp. TaxID=50421 RepID=UPI00374D6B13
MQTGLAWTALLMGLAGGPHCAAMCGAACSGVVRVAGAPRGMLQLQAGRLLGYTLAGGLAAAAVQNLAWLAEQTAVLRPVWTLFHVAVLVWGGMLLVLARQPLWVDGAGRQVWARVRSRVAGRRWVLVAGAAWALMPCGLLYSALLVASLSGGPLDGALSMALFALGSSITLVAGPWLWLRLQAWRSPQRKDLGMRLAGAALAGVAVWALLHDMDPRLLELCRSLW